MVIDKNEKYTYTHKLCLLSKIIMPRLYGSIDFIEYIHARSYRKRKKERKYKTTQVYIPHMHRYIEISNVEVTALEQSVKMSRLYVNVIHYDMLLLDKILSALNCTDMK